MLDGSGNLSAVKTLDGLRQLEMLQATTTDAVVLVDEFGVIHSWNPAAARITGFAATDVVGQTFFDRLLLPAHRPRMRAHWASLLTTWLDSPPKRRLDFSVCNVDGLPVRVELSLAVTHDDSHSWLLVVARDTSVYQATVAELGRAHEELETRVAERTRELTQANEILGNEIRMREDAQQRVERLANFDGLTGLANRALILNQMRLSLERVKRRRQRLALLYFDLDGFKEVNDTFGHAVGDDLLQRVAETLRHRVRASDLPARLAGDEFLVLMEEIDSIGDAHRLAERVRRGIDDGIDVDGLPIPCTFCIGVAIYPNHGETADDLLRHAHLAMHAAKRRGTNSICDFDPAMEQSLRQRIDLRSELRRAITRHEFVPWYQPFVCAGTRRPTAFEVLLRWFSPRRGMIGPDVFIPLLEESQDIVTVSDWLLEEVARNLQRWREGGFPPLRVGFNVSAQQFAHGYMTIIVGELCSRYEIDPGIITLEITEGAVMRDPDRSVGVLDQLRSLGCRIALDDFGTGYSSLSYLKRLPIDVLKIDRAFIRDIIDEPRDHAMVETIVGLAHQLDIEVVAEGVETADQCRLLEDMGCEFLQGFLFSKPLPEADFVPWVQQRAQTEGSLG